MSMRIQLNATLQIMYPDDGTGKQHCCFNELDIAHHKKWLDIPLSQQKT